MTMPDDLCMGCTISKEQSCHMGNVSALMLADSTVKYKVREVSREVEHQIHAPLQAN